MARQQRQFPQGKYILRTPRKSQNGQVYAVYLYYYWLGKQVRRSVDLTVALKDWNQDANGGAGEFRPSYGPNYKERNAYLRELMHDIDSKIMDYIKQHGEIDGDTIEAFVSRFSFFACYYTLPLTSKTILILLGEDFFEPSPIRFPCHL